MLKNTCNKRAKTIIRLRLYSATPRLKLREGSAKLRAASAFRTKFTHPAKRRDDLSTGPTVDVQRGLADSDAGNQIRS